jgi:VanZ family protein
MFKSTNLTWLFFLIVAGLLVTLIVPMDLLPESLMPFPRAEDKNNHIAIFLVFTLLSRYCLRLKWFSLSVLMTSIAAATELLQELSPHRTGSMLDFQANLLGIAAGVVTAVIANSLIQKVNKYYASGYSR